MLSVKKLYYKILECPIVTEQGTSGDWTYRKWSDGTAECWRKITSTAFAPSGAVGGFYGRELSGYGFPSGLFVSAPVVTVNCDSWGSGYHWAAAVGITSTTFKIQLLRNDNAASTLEAGVYAIGKWK